MRQMICRQLLVVVYCLFNYGVPLLKQEKQYTSAAHLFFHIKKKKEGSLSVISD